MNTANAEGFSSSISHSLERRDLDALQTSTSADTFSLTMTNEAFETHMINELYLQAVPRKANETIFHDKSGSFYTCGELINFNSAMANGKDINFPLVVLTIMNISLFPIVRIWLLKRRSFWNSMTFSMNIMVWSLTFANLC